MNQDETPLQAIFVEALEISEPQRRAAFLARVCGTDTPIRREVEELLLAGTAARNFLPDRPAANAARAALLEAAGALDPHPSTDPSAVEKTGDRIGRYRLLEKIGEGGCGVVYAAEQEEPVRRRVALKVIKLGMDTRNVIARFEAERQTLALMDHPNIARVFDAGATVTGRPFFVMELVQGIRVTHYCNQARLGIRERLELFIKICHAIQHAHQKGIIHRDLKPSNILVATNDGVVVPKVIDFGIAKAQAGTNPEDTLLTAFQQLLGTPAYMSPEQATLTNTDVDTRSDIYSLGVLLYELLTSKTPFDTKALLASGLDELRRTIREREPVRPSTRLRTMPDPELTTAALDRQTEATKLIHLVRGDLDWIVMKCLEKDRGRRYDTANGLALDIQRHLKCEPVLASPPSRLYEFQKTVRRHKLGFAAAAAVIVTLATGVTVSSWQWIRAERESQKDHRNVVRQYVANGTRLMNEGDLFDSLLWYTEALRLDAGDALREEPHRIRIASVLRQCPKLLNVFSHGNYVYDANFSPDGSRLVTSSDDHTARVWDVDSGKELLTLHHGGEVYHAAFSPDGRYLVTASDDKTARIWDAKTGAPVSPPLQHEGRVWDAAFSADGQTVATASGDKTARRWKVPAGDPLGQPMQHSDEVVSITFSPDGRLVATIGLDSTCRLWNPATGEIVFGPVRQSWNNEAIGFSPDSALFLVCQVSTVEIHGTAQGAPLIATLTNSGYVQSAAFNPDGSHIVTATENGVAQVWDATDGRPVGKPVVLPLTGDNYFLNLAISPDGRCFVTGSGNAFARVWSAKTGLPVTPALKHILMVKQVRYSPNGHRIASFSCDQAARVWDLASDELVSLPEVPAAQDTKMLTSASDGRLLKLDGGNTILVIDPLTGQPVGPRLTHPKPVSLAFFSPDGRTIVTTCSDVNARSSQQADLYLWNSLTGERLNQQEMHHRYAVLCATFSPDGKKLVTGSLDFTARLWDSRTGKPLGPSMRHESQVVYAGFDPSGKRAVTISLDNTARIWDTYSGEAITAPLRHGTPLTRAFFSADGRRLHTLNINDQLQVWDIARSEPLTPPRKVKDRSSNATSVELSLPVDQRPVKDLVVLAQMMAVGRLDANATKVPLELSELTGYWHDLKPKYPKSFAATTDAVLAWHQNELANAESETNWPAALFHLGRMEGLKPLNAELQKYCFDEKQLLAGSADRLIWRRNLEKKFGPRDPHATARLIDLSEHFNLSIRGGFLEPDDGLVGLKVGIVALGGVQFDIRGCIHLARGSPNGSSNTPTERVGGITVEQKCERLNFLQATTWETPDGVQVGSYILHYTDGQQRELPLVYGRDFRNFWTVAKEPSYTATKAEVVWTGENRLALSSGQSLRLFKSTRENPRPDVEITSIDFVSSGSLAYPFLIAITLE